MDTHDTSQLLTLKFRDTGKQMELSTTDILHLMGAMVVFVEDASKQTLLNAPALVDLYHRYQQALKP